jgi:hypothetical protein
VHGYFVMQSTSPCQARIFCGQANCVERKGRQRQKTAAT